MKSRIVVTLSIICLMISSYTFAESELKGRYSDDELIQIMRDEGYSSVKQMNDGAIKIKIDGRAYVLINNSDGDLQAYYGISGVRVSCENINEWNKTKRLSRAYLDSDNDPVIESDLLANGGLTPKHITEFFRVFKTSVRAFRKFLVEHDES